MRTPLALLSVLFTLAACDKGSSTTSGGIAPASEPAASSAPPAPPPPPPTTSAAATVSATAGTVAVAAVDAGRPKNGGRAIAAAPATKHIEGKNFTLDLSSDGCKAGEDCAVRIKLVATGEYHVNKEYPYKFIATPSPGVTFLGKGDPNTFTRAAGDYVEQGEKLGTMTVRFKAASAGEAKIAGKYKLSVCSDEQCLIEEEMLELAVPVM
jgi:hypothetical protein